MKNLWQHPRTENLSSRYVWEAEPALDLEQNSHEEFSFDPFETAGSVAFETEQVSDDVDEVISGSATRTGLAEERQRNLRTPGNPMGVLFGAQFERQAINPVLLANITLFTKGSILGNIKNAAPQLGNMLDDSILLSTGVKSALLNHTQKATLSAISSGKESSIKKTSWDTFCLLGPAIDQLFERILNDVNIAKELGINALNTREPFRKFTDISLGREERYLKRSERIIKNLEDARKEVCANMKRVEEQLTKQLQDTTNAIDMYQERMRNKNDSSAEGRFWGFVQSVIKDPDGFLSNRWIGAVNLNDAFGTTNRVRILDAIKSKFSKKVVELERSQQLTFDQEILISNMDRRETLTSNALENTDFEGLYRILERYRVQTFEGDEKKEEKEVLKIFMTGLRRLGIDTRRDIFRDAPVGLTMSERLTLLLQFLANNQEILNDPRCSMNFKRTVYTWIQDTHAREVEQLAQGSQAEDGTPAQRRYILNNANIVRNAAHGAIAALANIDNAMRSENPNEINEKLQTMTTFTSTFEEFFGEDGVSGSLSEIITKMPQDEQDLIKGLQDFKGLSTKMKEIIASLQEQRRVYVDEVLKNLPPSDELLESERTRAQSIADRLSEMVGASGGAGFNFSKEDFAALEAARSEIFKRVQDWDNAKQDLTNRHFDLPGTAEGFAGMLNIGRELQAALDAIPERDDIDAGIIVHDFNGLMQQRMQQSLQAERESKFEKALSANMSHQMNTLLSRKKDEDGDMIIEHAPESGMVLNKLDVADVTNTDGELCFPDSLGNREVFENLTLYRSTPQMKNEKCISANMIFHNDTHIVLIREKEGRVIAESWEKPENVRNNRNAVIRVPHTQPDAQFVVLNLSTAGTKAATWANGERRNIAT